MALEGDDSVTPYLRYRAWLVGLRIHINHNRDTGAFHFAGVAVDQVLQQGEALVAQFGALGEYLDSLLEKRGSQETAVHIGDDDRWAPPIDVGLHI